MYCDLTSVTVCGYCACANSNTRIYNSISDFWKSNSSTCLYSRQDVEALQEQQRQAEELKMAEEEKRRIHLERRKQEIEEEKRLIDELKQEQEEVYSVLMC